MHASSHAPARLSKRQRQKESTGADNFAVSKRSVAKLCLGESLLQAHVCGVKVLAALDAEKRWNRLSGKNAKRGEVAEADETDALLRR